MSTRRDQALHPKYIDALENGDVAAFKLLIGEEYSDDQVIYSSDDRYAAIAGRWLADLEFQGVESLSLWIDRADTSDALNFGVEERDFNAEFWARPQPLYHATKEKNLAGIESEGLRPRHETRGVSNRRVGASVFTSTDPEEISSYGPVVVKVDTAEMKRVGETLTVEREPDVEHADLRNRLARTLGCDEYNADVERGISEFTVIMRGAVPARFLSLAWEPSVRPLPIPSLGQSPSLG